jgi:hypothetical protein
MFPKAWPHILLVVSGVVCQQVVIPSDENLQTADLGLQPFTRIVGNLTCSAPDEWGFVTSALRMLPIKIDGIQGTTDPATGSFSLSGSFTGTSVSLEMIYDGRITSTVNATTISTRLQVMDEGHSTRTDTVTRSGTPRDTTLDLGRVTLTSVDCEIWRIGTNVLEDYHVALGASPPAGQLRVLRWSAVYVGSAYTYYDYVNLRTDWTTDQRSASWRSNTLFHEFGHTVRHVLDGSQTHWDCDNFNYAYARSHDGSEIFNAQYAFNEGWADYWAQARQDFRVRVPTVHDASYTEWNENLIANKLLADSELRGSSDAFMVETLRENPKKIHSLHEFEQKLFARLGRDPPPPTPICPPGFTDDGLTCRRDVSVVAKPSYGRGAGKVPNQCGAGRELDAGLCYPLCVTGYHGVGPVCWGSCPPNYANDGLTCRRDAKIIGADNLHRPCKAKMWAHLCEDHRCE